MKRAYHIPQGDPCRKCDLPRSAHRPEHPPKGDPCKRCLCAASAHRPYKPDKRTTRPGRKPRTDKKRDRGEKQFFIGIDGEGVGRDNHRYTMLARAGIGGTHKSVIEARPGGRLRSKDCLQFIVDCPNGSRIFSFAFSYDLTHILRDLPNQLIYRLLRPELRTLPREEQTTRSKRGPQPIHWRGFEINLLSRKLVVKKGARRRVVWDVFAFFQSKFTTALELWKVGEPEEIANMVLMKNQRHLFDKLTADEIRNYCFDECAKMAELAQKLLKAHDDAGLKLTAYYGAGSSASAALKMWDIDKAVRFGPPEMDTPVASAFFGGRFENSRIGEIDGPIWGYDISSAYPYQIADLPCLECGQWEHVTKASALRGATTAVVRYSLPRPKKKEPWGPFPFRSDDGSIAFPDASGGGWVWLSEYKAGKKLFPRVRFHEAWVYRTACKHKPFSDIPRLYVERLKLGKEGPGLVLKLAINSVYGKMAQSVGHEPPFQSWIWAGMVTAGCRAQLLDLMGRHKSLASVVMVATDGLYSTEKITPPKPRATGTNTAHKKPLGGWEITAVPQGMFAARPGIYFPLAPTDADVNKVRARGVGRAAMLSQWQVAVDALAAGDASVVLGNVTRFHAAKNTISFSPSTNTYTRSPMYGQWEKRQLEMTFDPMPKRARIKRDGTLAMLSFIGQESMPYDAAVISPEAMQQKIAAAIQEEQPDGSDFTDYDGWD